MSRKLKIAALQMDATPAAVADRLARAAELVAEAASAGAQLVVLPEVFNTGYEYHERNYALAEPMDGPTVRWMKDQAAQYGVHLAGTLMLLDEEDIYNSALLVAPNGQTWRYDKQYPFSWERAYFRENRHITVADTDLGRLGMMICWDAAHPDVWDRYAGKVDAMVIMSCPPKISSADLVFPDGLRVNTRELGAPWSNIYTEVEHFPGADMDEHAAWMRVPIVHTAGAGYFRTHMPEALASLSAYLAARPDLWQRLPQAPDTVLEAGYDLQTKVIDGTGRVVARVLSPGDGLTLAEVSLPDHRPQPQGKQPAMRTSPLAYLAVDTISAALATGTYRQGIRRQWGERMAPLDPRTRVWVTAVAAVAAAGWLAGRFLRRGEMPHLRRDRLNAPK